MTRETFTREMVKAMKAKIFAHRSNGPDYWEGYQRGLRRAYYGEVFGTEEEHNLWLSLADDEVDETRRERGRGYRDGLAI